MTSISPLSQLRAEDYPEQRESFSRLFFTLNPFFTSITQALQRGITFGDNITGQEKTLSFRYIGKNSLPIEFPLEFKGLPRELRVCQAFENDDPILAMCAWRAAERIVSINDIVKLSSSGVSGLTDGANYRIIIRISP
jgi:hypothetical protein